MSNINKILVPFDFSEAGRNALEYAINFVGYKEPIKIFAVQVTVASVSDARERESQEDFSKLLDRINRRTQIKPELIMVSGGLIEMILSIQVNQHFDMIMMGTMGDADEDAITNTSLLVLQANCPVITIPYGTAIEAPKEIALVLGKEEIETPKVLSTLLDIARTFDAKVHVLTIYKESIYKEQAVVESNENTLEYYLEHFYTAHDFQKNEDVEQGIYDYIKEKDIDLLAILPRNHAKKTEASEGRLTKLLTLHATVPVLTLD